MDMVGVVAFYLSFNKLQGPILKHDIDDIDVEAFRNVSSLNKLILSSNNLMIQLSDLLFNLSDFENKPIKNVNNVLFVSHYTLSSLYRRFTPVLVLDSDAPDPLHQGSVDFRRSKNFEQWNSLTLVQLPQTLLNAQNLLAGYKTALLAVLRLPAGNVYWFAWEKGERGNCGANIGRCVYICDNCAACYGRSNASAYLCDHFR
ncbi:hypothetical protein Dsin_015490 [Dipteronia sinensis]|uniref:Uncharacterized protein n=1 Tax=Dipteronia sinensis TaxID=43782 RepID=A0AAE0E4R0_9ROSI|nr:hypothetical protein Dsin_015490 [Dipteronia sinensis]